MRTVLERLLDYTAFDTQSDETTGTHPSTAKQRVLAEHLAEELRRLGAAEIQVTEHSYVYARLAATEGCEAAPALGFIAHLDTSDAASGVGVKPQIVRCWDGSPIPLGSSGLALDPALYPFMKNLIGHTLVTTDGTTLLGADDKAGIAEIMTALETIQTRNLPHGPLRIAFTPDEEIGEGPDFFDVPGFNAAFAYTMDGGAANEIEYQNFNAAAVRVTIRGRSVHPGSAKDIMINAQKIAFEFDSMLPPDEVPARTDGFQGFYHLVKSTGTVGSAELNYILRDHDADSFERRKVRIRQISDALNARYGAETVTAEIRDQYRNMEEIIRRHPFLIELAENAMRSAGLEPEIVPIRGGTDGARLSFMGLPCPNLGTGGYNYHGESEFADVEGMEAAVRTILNLVTAFSTRT